ncbi:hypothetical protein EV363DRAFT_1323388 [Boletus edulis]|nr:hypothetical protein EV363DRAFT_1323388 [Boletus edulis]
MPNAFTPSGCFQVVLRLSLAVPRILSTMDTSVSESRFLATPELPLRDCTLSCPGVSSERRSGRAANKGTRVSVSASSYRRRRSRGSVIMGASMFICRADA